MFYCEVQSDPADARAAPADGVGADGRNWSRRRRSQSQVGTILARCLAAR